MLRDDKGRFIKGNVIPNDIREKISKSMKGKSTEWLTGRKLSEEVKKKMSESQKKADRSNQVIHYGKDHWNWRGGVKRISDIIRNRKEYKQWRKSVFERDNYTCQNKDCKYCNNKKGVELHPHHIIPMVTDTSLIFDINNGITYCKKYHIKGGLHKNIKKGGYDATIKSRGWIRNR